MSPFRQVINKDRKAQHFNRWLPASYIARKLILSGVINGSRETEYLFDLGMERVMVVMEPTLDPTIVEDGEFGAFRFCVLHKDGSRNYPMEEILLPRRIDFELPDELPPLGEKKQPCVKRQASTSSYKRDQKVNQLAKLRAEGVCALCDNPAPFLNKDDTPYLETHHIIWLSRGGEDVPKNTVALCPNCHRKMHILDDEIDVKLLQLIASNSVRSLPKTQ